MQRNTWITWAEPSPHFHLHPVKTPGKPPAGVFPGRGGESHSPDEFGQAMDDVIPLPPHGRILHDLPAPPPLPRHFFEDERNAALAALQDPLRWDVETDMEPDASYVRPGIARMVLRDLRRGNWSIQAELDLHGLTRLDAKHELVDFLHDCKRRGIRCIRIIHGKGLGSVNREPVLKQHVRHWLKQRNEILAYVEARPTDGGSGAVLVLLKSHHR